LRNPKARGAVAGDLFPRNEAIMREKGKHGRWRARLTAFLGAALGLAILSIADARADERIVSVGGAVTEIIYALGRDALIAAVDTTSLYPPEALKTKPNVGYMRALSAEGVLSVRPSLIVAAEGAGPPAALMSLRESGVRLATIPNEASPAGVQRKILAIGELIGSSEGARMLAKEVDARFTTLAALRDRIEKPKRVLFVLSASGGRTMIGGKSTSADAIIALAGATNAAASIEGFKPMNDEAIVAAAPDVVLMMRRENASARDLMATPAFAATPAGKAQAIVEMDGNYLLGSGRARPTRRAISWRRSIPR
jgi:iron complex transport system substrate-binding protein